MIDPQIENEVLNFVEIIKTKIDLENIEYILDLGTADLTAAFAFSRIFPKAKIIAFECNPSSIDKCKEIHKQYNPTNITFIDKAVHNQNGVLNFYPVDMINSPSKNWKAGSFFPFNPDYVRDIENVVHEKDPIEVEAVKLKDFLQKLNINKIDLLWSDIQGAELYALEGMEDLIKGTRALYLEIEYNHKPTYLNHPCKNEIEKFLSEKDFENLGRIVKDNIIVKDTEDHILNISWANFIYLNKKYKI
jgi:FkbM family methyltransferase